MASLGHNNFMSEIPAREYDLVNNRQKCILILCQFSDILTDLVVVVILFPEEYNIIHSIHTTFQQLHKCIPLAVA